MRKESDGKGKYVYTLDYTIDSVKSNIKIFEIQSSFKSNHAAYLEDDIFNADCLKQHKIYDGNILSKAIKDNYKFNNILDPIPKAINNNKVLQRFLFHCDKYMNKYNPPCLLIARSPEDLSLKLIDKDNIKKFVIDNAVKNGKTVNGQLVNDYDYVIKKHGLLGKGNTFIVDGDQQKTLDDIFKSIDASFKDNKNNMNMMSIEKCVMYNHVKNKRPSYRRESCIFNRIIKNNHPGIEIHKIFKLYFNNNEKYNSHNEDSLEYKDIQNFFLKTKNITYLNDLCATNEIKNKNNLVNKINNLHNSNHLEKMITGDKSHRMRDELHCEIAKFLYILNAKNPLSETKRFTIYPKKTICLSLLDQDNIISKLCTSFNINKATLLSSNSSSKPLSLPRTQSSKPLSFPSISSSKPPSFPRTQSSKPLSFPSISSSKPPSFPSISSSKPPSFPRTQSSEPLSGDFSIEQLY
jgi:hypothetical protein